MGLEEIKKKVITQKSLPVIKEKYKDKKIVFTSGSFDVLHSGHAVYLSKCKSLGDILVVGIGRDKVIKKLKGSNRPINPENNRVFLIASLQDVDYVLLNQDTPQTIESAELDYIKSVGLLKPDIFCINKDNDRLELNKKAVENLGVKFMIMERDLPDELTPSSTSKIIKEMS